MKKNLKSILTVLVVLLACSVYGQNKGKKSTISEGTTVTGNIASLSDFDVYGELNGNFESEATLLIGETAKIKGNIKAANVTVKGNYEGEMKVTNLLSVDSDASVKGKADVGLLAVKEGATYIVTTTMPERTRVNAEKK